MKSVVVNIISKEDKEGRINIDASVNFNGQIPITEAMLHVATCMQALSQALGKLADQTNTALTKKDEDKDKK